MKRADEAIPESFYSVDLYCGARDGEVEDRMYMRVGDPCPDLETATRLGWYYLGKYHGDYALVFFERSALLNDDDGHWDFKPRLRLIAPCGDQGFEEKCAGRAKHA